MVHADDFTPRVPQPTAAICTDSALSQGTTGWNFTDTNPACAFYKPACITNLFPSFGENTAKQRGLEVILHVYIREVLL
jgi:hypothetical protein